MSQEQGCGCGCGCSDEKPGLQIGSRPADTPAVQHTELQITGMTCGHCVASVTEELKELSGVNEVEVILVANGTSTATVNSSLAIDDAALRAAVDEAGYELTGISH